ncbi:hypothetical protein [Azohydromonas australica]|uniref:hypothetical protein n=1 Tax=Azohydromonas australica TaxID=364039 RepID=UPI0004040975|nr:hypothetical protein [Azohydromonas australica]
MDWFERITGFGEKEYASTQARLQVDGDALVNEVAGRRWAMGRLEVVSLAELRARAAVQPDGPALVPGLVRGDIRELHLAPEQEGSLIQVASQFNLLEMVGPDISPEDGVTGYAWDRTQGPACAIAAGAATIYRNYLVPLAGGRGQRAGCQIDTLADLGTALGHGQQPLWTWRNGYALGSAEGLARVSRQLVAASEAEIDHLRGLLRIGLHWDVEVTDARQAPGPLVSQAYCSAMPVAYGRPSAQAWEPLARLVLEAAYEATLLTGVLNAGRGASRRVLLTRLGGGVFGNEAAWIDAAIERALRCVAGQQLDIVAVSR